MRRKTMTRCMSFFLSFALAFSLAMPTFAEDDCEHEYGDPTFEWSDDYSSCDAVFTCELCGDEEIIACEIESETTATCTTDGETTYTATCEFNDEVYSNEKIIDTSAFGHEYGEPEFIWADDYDFCVAVFSCVRGDDIQEIDCEIATFILEPTCVDSGKTVYVATVEFNDESYADTQEVTTDALGHDYGEPTFIWADDGSTVSASFICQRCRYENNVDGTVVNSEIVVEPLCETNGLEIFYGEVEVEFGDGIYYDEHEVTLNALGHDWNENQHTICYDEISHWEITPIYGTRYCCTTCGWYQEDVTGMSPSEQGLYLQNQHSRQVHGFSGSYYSKSVDVGATGEWVVDSPAYDETVTDWSTTYCARCTQKYDHEHEYEDPIFIWNEDGTELEAMFACSLGDDVQIVQGVVTSYEVYIAGDPAGANFDQPREATCTKDGQMLSEGYVTFNGMNYYDNCESIIPALGHDYNIDYVTENGKTYAVFTCSRCGDTQEIDATTLDYDVTKEPTCTETGLGVYSGTIDLDGTITNISVEEVIPALGHEWPEEPTPIWTSDGTLEGTTFSAYAECTRGDAVMQLDGEIARTEIETEPTCTDKGLMWVIGQTTYDGKVWESEYPLSINATGHTWGDTIVITPATCSTDGLGTHTCTVCGVTEEVEIPANGEHVYTEAPTFEWVDDYSSCIAKFHCVECGEEQDIECSLSVTEIPATCYQEGERIFIAYCTVNGETYTDMKVETLAKTSHEYEPEFEWSDDYSSCIAVFVCIHCGDSFELTCEVSKDNVQEVSCSQEGVIVYHATVEYDGTIYSDSETEVIDRLPHTVVTDIGYEAKCTTDGLTDGEHCSVCGTVLVEQEVIPALGHDWVETIVTEPTCSSTGTEIRVCNRCSAYETVELPMTDHVYTNNITFNWSSGYTECTAVFVCDECGQSTEVECTVDNVVTPPTHTADGHNNYTATCEFNGKIYEDIKSIVIPTSGHEYGEPTFVWSDNNNSCIAVFECVEGDDTVEATCTVTSEITREATCQEQGIEVYTANVTFEGITYTDTKDVTIAKLPHTPVIVEGYAPTCTDTGLTDGEICSICHEVLVAQETIAALGHDWDNGIITTAPTCTETGIRTYTCERCGTTRTESVAALGHSWGATETIVDPTCTDDGIGEHTCTRCGATEEVVINALGHDWSDWKVVTPATCSEEGLEKRICNRCDETETEPIAKLAHTIVTDEAVEPTCKDDGLTIGQHCSVCGEVLLAQDIIKATGNHTYSEWTVAKEATTSEEGLQVRYCTVCGNEQTEAIPKLEVVDGTAHEHTWDEGVVTQEATCTTLGETTYTCTICGTTEVIANIPATDHSYTEVQYIWTDKNGNQIYVDPETNALLGATDEFIWDDDVTCEVSLYCPDCDTECEVECHIEILEDENGIHYYAYPSDLRLDVYNEITVDGEGHITDIESEIDTLTGFEIGDSTAQKANQELNELVSYTASEEEGQKSENPDDDSNVNGTDDTSGIISTNSINNVDSGNNTDNSNNSGIDNSSESNIDGTTTTESVPTGDSIVLFCIVMFTFAIGTIGVIIKTRKKSEI